MSLDASISGTVDIPRSCATFGVANSAGRSSCTWWYVRAAVLLVVAVSHLATAQVVAVSHIPWRSCPNFWTQLKFVLTRTMFLLYVVQYRSPASSADTFRYS